MLKISHYFWQICLLRKGPEDLPSSTFATAFVFALYFGIAVVVVSITRPSQDAPTMLGTLFIGIGLQAGVTWGLLQFKGLTNRFRRTWSSLLGTNAIMLLVLLPFNFIMMNASEGYLRVFADSATWICLGWWLAIAGHIYHRASEVSVIQGSAIAFLIELLGVILAASLFPVTPA